MTVAQQESVGLGILALVFLGIFALTIRYQRREGQRHGWFFPSLFGVVLTLGLMVVTLHGGALRGL